MVGHLSSMCKTLDSVPNTTKTKQHKRQEKDERHSWIGVIEGFFSKKVTFFMKLRLYLAQFKIIKDMSTTWL